MKMSGWGGCRALNAYLAEQTRPFADRMTVAAIIPTLIANGHAVATTWIRVAVNYMVPYTVASIGYLSPFRVAKSQGN